jgi:hypothetical protein
MKKTVVFRANFLVNKRKQAAENKHTKIATTYTYVR